MTVVVGGTHMMCDDMMSRTSVSCVWIVRGDVLRRTSRSVMMPTIPALSAHTKRERESERRALRRLVAADTRTHLPSQ